MALNASNSNTLEQLALKGLRLVAEKAGGKINSSSIYCFIGVQEAFDSVNQHVTRTAWVSCDVDSRLIGLLKHINENAKAAARIRNE